MNVDYDISQWVKLADMDLEAARNLFAIQKPMPCEIICFHSQQAAEKILKGFLFFNNVKAPKTHNLEELCNMCIKIEPKFNGFDRELNALNRYSVFSRYPNEFELEEHDAETAIKYADKVMAFVKGLLGDIP